jgi:hypothetical protein
MKLILFNIAIISTFFLHGQDTLPGTRDPWQWPFSANSIWNMPIGENATYEPANLKAAANVGADIQIILSLKKSDPARKAYGSSTWGPGRCNAVNDLNFSLNIPDNWIVPDAGKSPYGLTPNSNFAFRLPDSDMVFEGSKVSRCEAAGPVYFPDWMIYPNNRKQQNIKGEGLSGGGQGASGMSALGGTIRLGEFTSDQPIRHSIKINPFAAKYCYYSKEIPGYKWPAISADSYAKDQYKGSNPKIVMGTLFAILPGVTEESLNLTTIPGKKLFFAMQNYGVYFTEDAAWDTWDIIVERDAELEFVQAFGFSMSSQKWKTELNKLMQSLHIVTNNNPGNIGGGGIPLQPYAPAFSNPVTGSSQTSVSSGQIVVYPNPVTGNTLNLSRESSVEIFNLYGALSLKAHNVTRIEIDDLPGGVYFIRLTDDEGFMQQEKFVKLK